MLVTNGSDGAWSARDHQSKIIDWAHIFKKKAAPDQVFTFRKGFWPILGHFLGFLAFS